MKKFKINHHNVSYTGRRKNNEDSSLIEITKKSDNRQIVLSVADGMGGYQKGDIASKMVINYLKRLNDEILPTDPDHAGNIIKKYIEEANQSMFEKTERTKDFQMGTTVSGAVVINNRCLFFNVGDSRTYLINSGDVKQVTMDHSTDGEDLRNGAIKESEVGKGHYSHALTRSIGIDPDVDVDIFPMQGFHELEEGEVILSCTDGLWRRVTKEEISREIFGRKNLDESLEALATLAYSKGSDDNISIVALEYGILKRKKEKLKSFVPMNKFEKKTQGNKSKILKALLVLSIVVLVAILAMLIIRLNNTTTTPIIENQSQINPDIIGDNKLLNPQVKNVVENNYKPEVQKGKITFIPKAGTYRGGAQVQLIYENLKSLKGYRIPSEAYYTTDGSEPTKNKGKKYVDGKKIMLGKPGEYWVKVKLFSKKGKYEGKIHRQRYNIIKKEIKVPIITSFYQLDKSTREDISSKTKKFKLKIEGIKKGDISGIMKIILYISSSGQAEVIKFSGIRARSTNKSKSIKDGISWEIQGIKFLPPTSEGKAVKVKTFIDLEVKAVFHNEIKFERIKNIQ